VTEGGSGDPRRWDGRHDLDRKFGVVDGAAIRAGHLDFDVVGVDGHAHPAARLGHDADDFVDFRDGGEQVSSAEHERALPPCALDSSDAHGAVVTVHVDALVGEWQRQRSRPQ
jgi:hypothetical protein